MISLDKAETHARHIREAHSMLNRAVAAARKDGIKVAFKAAGCSVNDVDIGRIWLDRAPIEL